MNISTMDLLQENMTKIQPEQLNCGRLTRSELLLWINVQYWAEGILFSFVGTVGFIGNLISIAILITKEMRKHSFNQMLLGLAFYDLIFVSCGVPVHISPIFGLENWLYALLYAYFLYPFTAVALTGSIYMTMAITVERYIAVCHPHYYRDLNARVTPWRRVLVYALPVTTFSILVNIPKFLETQVQYSKDTGVQYDVTDLRLNPTYIWWYTLSYICHPLLTTTVGPFFVLTFFNYRIYKGIKKARTNVHSSNRHGEMNLARVLVTICVVFLACNSLRLFLGLQAIINVNITIQCVSQGKAWIPPNWMLIMESISHLLLLISSSSNFLIYCTISTKFKIYIKRKFCFRNSSSPTMADIPEVNSRVALRTIGKSLNECEEEQAMIELGALPKQPPKSASPMGEDQVADSPQLQHGHQQQQQQNLTGNEDKFGVLITNAQTCSVKMETRCISTISMVTSSTITSLSKKANNVIKYSTEDSSESSSSSKENFCCEEDAQEKVHHISADANDDNDVDTDGEDDTEFEDKESQI